MTTTSKKTGNPSGFTDTLPAEKLLFNRLMQILSQVVESYGFSPIDTPEIEWLDTLKGHDDSGGKLIYRIINGYENPETSAELEKVIDKGLRFDLTVPLARFYGQHAHELPLPFRRYHWGKVFRGETAQTGKGRYREFYQFDADTIGATGPTSDAETATMLLDAMKQLKLPAIVKINNRYLLDGLVEIGSLAEESQKNAIFTAIDKFDKIGKEKVLAEVAAVSSSEFTKLVDAYLSVRGTPVEKIDQLQKLLGKSPIAQIGLGNLKEITTILTAAGYENGFTISPEIVRGLGYYTGAIFETYITGYEQFGSVASGGRYDNLIATLGGPNQPAVGASFGVSRLLDVLQQHGWESASQTPAQVLILNFDSRLQSHYVSLAATLRAKNVSTLVYSDTKKIGPQLQYADKLGIPIAIIIGETEFQSKTAVLRDLKTREQVTVSIDNVESELQKKLSSLVS